MKFSEQLWGTGSASATLSPHSGLDKYVPRRVYDTA